MAATAGVDWSAAQMTTAAGNVKPEDRNRVIRVPRAVFAQHWETPRWTDLEQAAFAGVDGVEPWWIAGIESAPRDYAYLREGVAKDGSLRGRCLLLSQGW